MSLLSYAGRVWVGVQSDIGLVPDPERILAGFEAELEALRAIPAPGPRRRAGGGQEPGRARSDRIRRRSAPGRPSPARPAPS
ncbi:MAG TPA: WS/DGAT domain-containing protein [Myxococcaceae bacterium]|nr:WS/DGAT domain-containing protein [Myxococcaceae bacterium]